MKLHLITLTLLPLLFQSSLANPPKSKVATTPKKQVSRPKSEAVVVASKKISRVDGVPESKAAAPESKTPAGEENLTVVEVHDENKVADDFAAQVIQNFDVASYVKRFKQKNPTALQIAEYLFNYFVATGKIDDGHALLGQVVLGVPPAEPSRFPFQPRGYQESVRYWYKYWMMASGMMGRVAPFFPLQQLSVEELDVFLGFSIQTADQLMAYVHYFRFRTMLFPDQDAGASGSKGSIATKPAKKQSKKPEVSLPLPEEIIRVLETGIRHYYEQFCPELSGTVDFHIKKSWLLDFYFALDNSTCPMAKAKIEELDDDVDGDDEDDEDDEVDRKSKKPRGSTSNGWGIKEKLWRCWEVPTKYIGNQVNYWI